jgi:hypothetical protein
MYEKINDETVGKRKHDVPRYHLPSRRFFNPFPLPSSMDDYRTYHDICERGALALRDLSNVEAPFTAIRELADHIDMLAYDESLADICKEYLGQEQSRIRDGLRTIALDIRFCRGEDHAGLAAALAEAYHRELMKIN